MTTTLEHASTSAVDKSDILLQVRSFVEHYALTFVELVLEKQTNIAVLLNFFSAPLRVIGSNFNLVMSSNDAMIGENALGGEIKRLRQAGFATSKLDQYQVNIITPEVVLVDTVWLRYDVTGALMARIGVIYLVTMTTDGWRITSVINKSL